MRTSWGDRSFFSHLECSVPCGAAPLDPHQPHHLCGCGAPLFARYDLDRARRMRPDSLAGRPPTMWRYRELLPLFADEEAVSLGEGFTPLVHARTIGIQLGLPRLYVKDESLNPTNSFKARGLSAAITRAKALGARTVSIPSAGNAGNAAAAYAAKAGLRAQVFLPRDAKRPFVQECALYGAGVTLVDGNISDAARVAAERGGGAAWYDLSTLKEPYRIEGKKTLAYEMTEQMNWRWPDWIVYPAGGGTGLIGMWKAFGELEQLGWVGPIARPRMVAVQAEGCAPIVRAFQQGLERATLWPHASTVADGLRVPGPIGDFLMLRAIRESGGSAVAVPDRAMIEGMLELGRTEGISASPEGGATLAALKRLIADQVIAPDHSVVLFNTGGALKYLDVIA